MRLKLIACNVFLREICLALAESPHTIDLEFTELGEHVHPDVLNRKLQERIEAAASNSKSYEAILLGFGICRNAGVGLEARRVRLVMPRAHDCCTVLLGVIDEEGENLGMMYTREAIAQAAEVGLDLVEVSPNADPPVCKIMDYRKFKFDKSKKLQKSRKKQATQNLKEIRMRPMIDTHDYEFKKRSARRFIEHGYKVKVTMRFKGREMSRQELGAKVLNRLVSEVADIAKVEIQPKMEGRQMVMILMAL